MPHQKLFRVLTYIWLLVVFPVAVAILIGMLGQSASIGIRRSPISAEWLSCALLNAVISDDNHTHHHRRK